MEDTKIFETTPEQTKINELIEINQNLAFFSDQVRFNAILFDGFKMILDKLTKIEENLNKKQDEHK